jgi:hypothetical protein
LSGAKSAAENGQVNCRELRNLVIQAVNSAGGRIDYAEVSHKTSSLPWCFFFFFFFGHKWFKSSRCFGDLIGT